MDFGFLPAEDGLVVELPPGEYEVSARVMAYPGDRRIARLRVLPKDCAATLGGAIGETWVDTAATAICDANAIGDALLKVGDDAATDQLEQFCESHAPCGVFAFEAMPSACAPFVDSGFGDGSYEVMALCSDGRNVGVEIEFIKPNTTYPFGEAPTAVGGDAESKGFKADPWRDLASLFATLSANRTGDISRDRNEMKAALDGFLGELQSNAISAADEFCARCTQLRQRRVPLQIHVVPMDSAWISKPAVAERLLPLMEAGFVQIGCFEIKEVPGFLVCGLHHPARHVEGSIELDATEKVTLCLDAQLADGTFLTVTDQPPKSKLPLPPWQRRKCNPGISAKGLIEGFLDEFTDSSVLPLSAEGFVARMEESFRRVQYWRADRGGWSLSEIKCQRGLPDSAETTEELSMIRRDSADTWLCNWLRMQEGLSFDLESVLENLVIIHDELDLDLLVNEWQARTHDFKAGVGFFREGSPREAFSRVNRERGGKLRLILEKATGLAADFYLPA